MAKRCHWRGQRPSPLAEIFELTVYTAAYLELALRKDLPLASRDEPVRKAMKKAGGVLLL